MLVICEWSACRLCRVLHPPSLLVFVVSCQFVLLAKTHPPILLPSASRWPIDGSEVLGVTLGENHAWGSGLAY